ncbi:MAG: Rpn family recombination-promoting nuclease/putative transposase [Dysgonamonadaceae bacterium]|jgi:predicted transposase/invertase (TIGR01784 family)|nr:Rpn family recombination-promoting nuclease/putative transposase [Dysgonamonadaceae bacterium]
MLEKLNLLNDYLFMKYMGEKGDEEQLTAFLSAVLQRTGRGRISSVEIVENKALTAEIIGGINAGSDYVELPDVIAVNIIDFDFMPELPDVHTCFHLWEDSHKDQLLTEALEIHFVNMYRFRQLKKEEKDIVNSSLHRWLTFFSKETDEETIKKIIEMDKAIGKAHEKVAYVSRDAETLRLYNMREMALMDYVSGINHARREGIAIGEQKGIAIGKQEALSEYVFKLVRKGKSVAEISELTDLPPEEVNRILNR